MHPGARAICLLMALLAAVTELVSTAFGQVEAKPSALPNATVNETAAIAAQPAATVQKIAAVKAAKVQNFSMSPLELRIMTYAPQLRVIGSSVADSRQMASLADANERQLLFVKTTLG
jgi:hypothetical protein